MDQFFWLTFNQHIPFDECNHLDIIINCKIVQRKISVEKFDINDFTFNSFIKK